MVPVTIGATLPWGASTADISPVELPGRLTVTWANLLGGLFVYGGYFWVGQGWSPANMQLAEALARQVAINGGLWVFAGDCNMEKAEFENCYWIASMKGKVMAVSGTLGTCISSTVAGLTSSSIDMFMLHEALMGCDPRVTTL